MMRLCALLAAVVSVACSTPSLSQPMPSSKTPTSTVALAPMPHSYDARIPQEAQKYRRPIIKAWQYYFGLDETPATAFAQIHQESRFKAGAQSPVGAEGLAQFMPTTSQWIAALLPPDVRDSCPVKSGCPEDPTWAINALSNFDRRLFNVYKIATGDEQWGFALAAYNAGQGSIDRERTHCTRPCDSFKWFRNVENVCTRRKEACQESKGYATIILRTWKPLYVTWLTL